MKRRCSAYRAEGGLGCRRQAPSLSLGGRFSPGLRESSACAPTFPAAAPFRPSSWTAP